MRLFGWQPGMSAAEISAYNLDEAGRFHIVLAQAFQGNWQADPSDWCCWAVPADDDAPLHGRSQCTDEMR